MNEEFEQKLFELCLKYGTRHDSYPESEHGGSAIYEEYVEQFPGWKKG